MSETATERQSLQAPPRVLVVAEAGSQERLTALLSGDGMIVFAQRDVDGGMPEVIVADRRGPTSSSHALPDLAAHPPALIAIAPPDGTNADVTLPEDFSPRELVLACRLLAQVVRLKRQLDEGSQQEQAWREEASCDPLTQLPNRRAWNEELRRRFALRGTGQSLCVALLDLDHFKQVNDGWGHAAGDQLLVAVAGALKQSLRQDDFVARLGGDEFGLLLSGVDPASAAGIVERIRAGLPARMAPVTRFVTSASVGYCIWQGEGVATPESLLAHADRACRVAKAQGRDRAAAQ